MAVKEQSKQKAGRTGARKSAAQQGVPAPDPVQPEPKPSHDWTDDQLGQFVDAQVAIILKHEEDNGYVTAAYWRLAEGLRFMRSWFDLLDITESKWCEQHNINATRKSRAKSIRRMFTSAEEAGKVSIPAFLKMLREQKAEGKPKESAKKQLKRKLDAIDKALEEAKKLKDELPEQDRQPFADQIAKLEVELHVAEELVKEEEQPAEPAAV